MPMLDMTEQRYAQLQRHISDAVRELRKDYEVFFFNETVSDVSSFRETQFDADAYVAELDRADYFVAVLPHKIVSSVHFEAGFAVAKGKPVVIFVSQERDVPLLARKLAKASPNLKLIAGLEDADLLPQLRQTLRAFKTHDLAPRRRTV